ncbi:MAG TPA: acyclic terpene utilization AtuA family protein [Pirellulales bacterium]|nr:acyclic terpene utilization AtuA family protein [Pirellulales bacterium]
MPPSVVTIGNGAGFLGDNLDAPRRLVETARLDYLTLEYLAELTLSILARLREKDPHAGYAEDFLTVLQSLVPPMRAQPGLRLVTNAGGMNPLGCARRAAAILSEAGLADVSLAVVTGDDLLPRLAELERAGCELTNLDTGQPLSSLHEEVVSANAYLGAGEIAAALADGAQMVITGRVADASLTVGPAMHHFGWRWDDWPRLAGASVAGHLIECGSQATGGFYSHWNEIELADVGYPIAEIAEDATCVLTKPAGSGGRVNRETVTEQLVYEIGDPAHYLTPDVDLDFTTVEVDDLGGDRVAVRGTTGRPAPEQYKVSLTYRGGYFASGQMLCYGRDAVKKARSCAAVVLARLRAAGYDLDESHVECLGAGEAVPGVPPPPADLREVMLRLTVRDRRREAVERFTREFAPLTTSGPAGLAGYASGRPQVRPVLAYWPALVPKELVSPRHETRSAAEWCQSARGKQ